MGVIANGRTCLGNREGVFRGGGLPRAGGCIFFYFSNKNLYLSSIAGSAAGSGFIPGCVLAICKAGRRGNTTSIWGIYYALCRNAPSTMGTCWVRRMGSRYRVIKRDPSRGSSFSFFIVGDLRGETGGGGATGGWLNNSLTQSKS